MHSFLADAITDDTRFYFKGVSVLFLFGIISGVVAAFQQPQLIGDAVQQLHGQFSFLQGLNPLDVFGLILANNIVVILILVFAGMLWGIPSALIVMLNGYIIGMIAEISVGKLGLATTLAAIAPHGIFEIPAFLLAASYGVFLGERTSITFRTKEPLRPYIRQMMRKVVRYVLPLLFIAALIETFVVGDLVFKIFS